MIDLFCKKITFGKLIFARVFQSGLIARTSAIIEQTRDAIRRTREASQADASLARALDHLDDRKPVAQSEGMGCDGP